MSGCVICNMYYSSLGHGLRVVDNRFVHYVCNTVRHFARNVQMAARALTPEPNINNLIHEVSDPI